MIRAAKMIIADHPLGVGPNQYLLVANIGGYSSRAGVAWNAANRSAPVHNSYYFITAELGFVGLIVPHLVRPLAGHWPSAVLLPSALAGALLLTLADSLVRIVPSASELRLGIAMSLLGAPFFLFLLFRMRRELA